jgi:retron-type reverse transcriptase
LAGKIIIDDAFQQLFAKQAEPNKLGVLVTDFLIVCEGKRPNLIISNLFRKILQVYLLHFV